MQRSTTAIITAAANARLLGALKNMIDLQLPIPTVRADATLFCPALQLTPDQFDAPRRASRGRWCGFGNRALTPHSHRRQHASPRYPRATQPNYGVAFVTINI